MDDDTDLRDIFKDFRPPLRSEQEFMADLSRGLDAVEMIRRRSRALQRRRRWAMAGAVLAGMAVGAVLTLTMPWLSGAAASWCAGLMVAGFEAVTIVNFVMIIIGAGIVLAATWSTFAALSLNLERRRARASAS